MTRPELVLFDLDGTLVDESGLPDAMRRACAAVAKRIDGVTEDELIAANSAEWQELWPEVEDDWMLGGRPGGSVAEDAWRGTLRRVGVEDAATLELALATWSREEETAHRVYDDVEGTLAAFEGAGVRLGVVSNGAASVQRGKLEVLGLATRFPLVFLSSELGDRKPGTAIFETATATAGVRPEGAWYVGDNLWSDVPGAQGAGLRTAWVDRRGFDLQPDWPRPDLVVASLAELPEHLLSGTGRGSVTRTGQEPR